MINYILGGLIIAVTVYIVVKQIKHCKAGRCGCGHECAGCGGQCGGNQEEG